MCRYLGEGIDINLASDKKRALDSYGGVKSCRIAVLELDISKQDINDHNWKGIQSLNNFEFRSTGIRVWKAFSVGTGKLVKNKELKDMASLQRNTGLCIVDTFSDPVDDKGAFKRTQKKENPQRRRLRNRMTLPQTRKIQLVVSTVLKLTASKYLHPMALLNGISI